MGGRADSRAERARLRATRVPAADDDGKVRLVAVGRRHGARRTYDVYGCECAVCRAAAAARLREYRTRKREREGRPEYTPEVRAETARRSARRAPVPELRVCALDECDELIPLGEGMTPSTYARLRYHSTVCANLGRAATLSAQRGGNLGERQCECGCGPFLPTRATLRFASKSCANRFRYRGGPERPTKTCKCGCGQTFERPLGIGVTEWNKRRFLDAEHRKRAAGESRAGKRRAPAPVPSRDRKQKATPKPAPRPSGPPRTVFGDVAPAEPFRPGRVPVIERHVRTAPRPSFGLTRRIAPRP